ncbi:MAG: alpha/beta fold hydrolase [Actinomycetes bacterium]
MGATTPLSPSAAELAKWGLDPHWSRRITFPGADGSEVDWHALDTGPGTQGTIVCVHGNPTWGYLWRDLLTTLSPAWRVIAVDQTGMGYSERGRPRVLAERIEELVTFCRQEVEGPLILAAHDWGGPVAVGAAGSLEIEALILGNTAVAKPVDVKVPPLIAAARAAADLTCRRSPLFVDGTAKMTNKEHRAALRAPYRSADRRSAVRDFVLDIPVKPQDHSYDALGDCADVFAKLRCPILLLWGGKDPVFHDRFLRDLTHRAPHADVQRFQDAGHVVMLDAPVGAVVSDWLESTSSSQAQPEPDATFRSVLAGALDKSADQSAVYVGPEGTLTWSELAYRSAVAAGVLRADGLAKGDRVSLLIPPSPDLLVAACAVWRCGGVPVVADASAGIRTLRRLVRANAPRYVIGTRSTLLAARALRFAPAARSAIFGALPGTLNLGRQSGTLFEGSVSLESTDIAAIVHTSGATGPAKAVRYTHGQLVAQREATKQMFNLDSGDAFTTSFGAFMLLAPLLGMTCVRPDFEIDKPSTLGFEQLNAATNRAHVTTAWLSPASANAVIASASGRSLEIPLVMLAGAPVSASLLRDFATITGGEVRTPYGMTECLPVTDGIRGDNQGPHGGVGVGSPLPGCEIRIGALGSLGQTIDDAHDWGEILVAASWLFDGYENATDVDFHSTVFVGFQRFHRTGDVGYLNNGRLFVLGRSAHVIDSAVGPLASVALEETVAEVLNRDVAAVGVGPTGTQVVCVVLRADGPLRLAPPDLRDRVRESMDVPVAAVLEGNLPTDHRHESKIDRIELGRTVSSYLAGR